MKCLQLDEKQNLATIYLNRSFYIRDDVDKARTAFNEVADSKIEAQKHYYAITLNRKDTEVPLDELGLSFCNYVLALQQNQEG